MRAARIFDDLSLRVADAPVPAAGPGQVLREANEAYLRILDRMVVPSSAGT